MLKLEHCFECDAETGRAGKSDDSLYCLSVGPFCEDCWEAYPEKLLEKNNELQARIDELEQQLKIYQKAVGDHNDKMGQEGIWTPDYKVMIPIGSAILKEEVNDN